MNKIVIQPREDAPPAQVYVPPHDTPTAATEITHEMPAQPAPETPAYLPSYISPEQYAANEQAAKDKRAAQDKEAQRALVWVAALLGLAAAYELGVLLYYAIRYGGVGSALLVTFTLNLIMLGIAFLLLRHVRFAYTASKVILVVMVLSGLMAQSATASMPSKISGWLMILAAGLSLYLLSDATVKRLFR